MEAFALSNPVINHLLCPDCKGKIDAYTLRCTKCSRVFIVEDNILQILPLALDQSDIACDKSYEKWGQTGAAALPLNILLHRADSILYFNERILPHHMFSGKVLEIGSGSCWLSSLIKLKFPSTTTIATDVSNRSLKMGTEVTQFLGAKIDCFANCKVENLPFEDQYFDFVIGSAVLHQTNPSTAIKEIYRVLKKGGQYIGVSELAIPKLMGSIWGSRFGSQGKDARSSGISYGHPSLKTWYCYFKQAGFQVIELTVDKNPKYKHSQWQNNLYYSIVSHLSDSVVRRFLAFSLDIRAQK